jgi:hypothetical protein
MKEFNRGQGSPDHQETPDQKQTNPREVVWGTRGVPDQHPEPAKPKQESAANNPTRLRSRTSRLYASGVRVGFAFKDFRPATSGTERAQNESQQGPEPTQCGDSPSVELPERRTTEQP